mmetsp:Transcript_27786/g.94834  ORF Transcript_27786/g.94834 Transcript_27786/m.94834 type:complete len:81 (-) Transcript_27786:520-762(-)
MQVRFYGRRRLPFGQVLLATCVGIASGFYIFDEPLRKAAAELKAKEAAAAGAQAAAKGPAAPAAQQGGSGSGAETPRPGQ